MNNQPVKFKIEKTGRGFEIAEFKDAYGKYCSLQQSSIAGYEIPGITAIWLGKEGARMHLNHYQVQEVIHRLTNWLNTGSFEDGHSIIEREEIEADEE